MVKQGDIVWVDFDPALGHEQKGKRPGLIVSSNTFTKYTKNLVQIIPITSKSSDGFPMHILLDHRTSIKGELMCEQIKTMDLKVRKLSKIEALPRDLLVKTLTIIGLIFTPDE